MNSQFRTLHQRHAEERLRVGFIYFDFTRLPFPIYRRDKDVKRLVLCSGKVAYDLMEARNAAGDTGTAIVRLEQLYPFPGEPLVARLKRMTNVEEVVWAQEEPKNNGSWYFLEDLLEECLVTAKSKPKRPRYAGRKGA